MHDLGVDERPHARHCAEPGLEPEVLAVRALPRPADADPAGDVTRGDLGRANGRDRRADTVASMRRLVPCVRVAAVPGVRQAGATTGSRRLGRSDERGHDERTCEQREQSVSSHPPEVGSPFGVSHPPEGRSSRTRVQTEALPTMRAMARIEDCEASGSVRAWREGAYDRAPERHDELFSTISGVEAEPLYAPDNVDFEYGRDLGYPGEFPFTRGVYPSMYRGRLWTMRQFAGFGTAEETNERFRYLLDHGQTGLSTAFDMPTLMGYDSDHARSIGEVGREGVAVDSLADAETLFDGIPLGEVSTSMTINSPAAILLAYYVSVGEQQGVPRERLRGTAQTDILKEYIAQKEWIYPPEPSMRLVVDMIEFCSREMPLFHPISISGYHIREAGSTAAQELAFTSRTASPTSRRRSSPAGGRRVRASPLVLLQRAPRLLRGDREVPGGAPDLGARDARALRRRSEHSLPHALPHPDGGRVADGAAAGGEHRPHGARGARGGARRDAEPAHELLRRGARAADGGRGADRAAHPAGDRARVRAS